ncbi:cAMP-dependent protein kinase regulatory subunit [Diplonema papillatum]|nr:cAMP-dependent protein kinase regulatory subunit [Diplonema papillatum]
MSEEIYREYCKKRGVKKAHPDVLKCIREGSVASLDFSETYLGNRGLLAVLDMLEHLPECRELNLKSQKIYNTDLSPTSVKGNVMLERLMEVASRHPSLSSLTLSDNPLSNLAGRRLLDLIAKNELITSVAVDDTYIDADLCKMISGACGKNAAKAGPRQPVPPPDPAATGSKRPAVSLPEAGDRPTGGEDPADDPFSFAKSEDPFVPGRRQSSITDTQANDMLKLGGLKKHRKTVAAPAVSMEDAKNYKPPTFPKSADELAKLVTFLKANLLFSHLASEDVETCAHAMDKITFKKGDTPCVREVEGDSLYILTSGSANVLKENPENPEEEVVVWTKAADGDAVFGELELMYDHPCTATITIATDAAEAWKMGREDYQNLVMGSAIRKREIHMENLKNIKFLSDMGHADLVQLADALETNEYVSAHLQHTDRDQCCLATQSW